MPDLRQCQALHQLARAQPEGETLIVARRDPAALRAEFSASFAVLRQTQFAKRAMLIISLSLLIFLRRESFRSVESKKSDAIWSLSM